MPQLRCKRSLWPGLALALSMGVVSPIVTAADPVPPGLRACGAEADPEKRLACFDRELARFPASTPKATAKRDAAPAANTGVTDTPAPTPSAGRSAAASAQASTALGPAAAAAKANDATTDNSGQAAAKASQHVSARIVSIDPAPGEMTLHLDNGQVWQQVQGVSGDLSLRPGDTVTIEKHLGSYWLAGPHVANMRVRQKS